MKTFTATAPLTGADHLTLQTFHEQAMLFDIETTGLSAGHHKIFLIGCASRQGDQITVRQHFAESPQEESAVLQAFLDGAPAFQSIISFNGLGFDIPFLQERCQKLGLSTHLSDMEHVDLYRLSMPYKHTLKLENMKQKTLEDFLGIPREDDCSGRDLISLYDSYCKSPTDEALRLILLHNYEDVRNMIGLIPLLSYGELFQGNFSIQGWTEHAYQKYEGGQSQELILSLLPTHPLPRQISYGQDSIYLSGHRTDVRLRAPIHQGELKYFYHNYKDYYYLPQEDMAIHKSVASYVDKDFRRKATASTCYSKKSGRFLPQYHDRFSPHYKLEYNDKASFLEMNDAFTASPEFQKEYALHLLRLLAKP